MEASAYHMCLLLLWSKLRVIETELGSSLMKLPDPAMDSSGLKRTSDTNRDSWLVASGQVGHGKACAVLLGHWKGDHTIQGVLRVLQLQRQALLQRRTEASQNLRLA